ncbi:uncharacterized protein LOC126611679 [Malus sylvestris]|uniref:uncharacterized protein LOC126611679 n=1 Tax=Malus sylvestris TaxID=3752 RepID=UPI0021AC5224|nr:uncharacterized protein LOC126611679 [Malus sylvestris]
MTPPQQLRDHQLLGASPPKPTTSTRSSRLIRVGSSTTKCRSNGNKQERSKLFLQNIISFSPTVLFHLSLPLLPSMKAFRALHSAGKMRRQLRHMHGVRETVDGEYERSKGVAGLQLLHLFLYKAQQHVGSSLGNSASSSSQENSNGSAFWPP